MVELRERGSCRSGRNLSGIHGLASRRVFGQQEFPSGGLDAKTSIFQNRSDPRRMCFSGGNKDYQRPNLSISRYRPHVANPSTKRSSLFRYYQNPFRLTTDDPGAYRLRRGIFMTGPAEFQAVGNRRFHLPDYCRIDAAEFRKAGVKSNARNRPSHPSIQMSLFTDGPKKIGADRSFLDHRSTPCTGNIRRRTNSSFDRKTNPSLLKGSFDLDLRRLQLWGFVSKMAGPGVSTDSSFDMPAFELNPSGQPRQGHGQRRHSFGVFQISGLKSLPQFH